MSKTLKVLLIVFGVIVVAAAGYVVYQKYYVPAGTPATSASPATSTSTPSSKPSVISDTGVNWIAPAKLDDLKLFTNSDVGMTFSSATYYRVATLDGGGEIILAIVQWDSPGAPELYRFKKNTDGTYNYLSKYSATQNFSDLVNNLAKSVVYDANTAYQSLSVPDFLNVANTTFKVTSDQGLFSDLTNPSKIGDTAYGPMYRAAFGEPNTTQGFYYPVKLADGTYRGYTIKPDFITDNEVALITWKDGSVNAAKYTSEGYFKCGLSATNNEAVDAAALKPKLTEIGQTKKGEKVYTVPADDKIITLAYENYKIGRDKNVISQTEFASQKPIFIWQAGTGDFVIFTGRDFAGLAECGKPVIYLYPEKTEKVTVKVGAKITQSEPAYDGGWEVIASPSGKLSLGGKTYESLYWEGTGQEYPILNEGVVVKTSEVASTLKNQLQAMGLNQKETADFLEFWLPKMPNTAYVRLTWFGTNLMDKLAPLSVTPKPDTIFRVFLDFEGLNAPKNITAQKLPKLTRQGFTVVEWGGLLRK